MPGRNVGIAVAIGLGLAVGFGGSWLWNEIASESDPIALPVSCATFADEALVPGSAAGMVRLTGGRFKMGSEDFRAEEAPIRDIVVGDFWIDRHHVTNAQYRRFAEATGYVSVAERPGSGSFVFQRPSEIRDLADIGQWWVFVPGATWRSPSGPGSDIRGRDAHPVVHIAQEDASAYARWLGRRLPREAEWEFAARGGLDGAAYVWGDGAEPGGKPRANVWRGVFPHWNRNAGNYVGTVPVGCYDANGYGLYDMAGNVWQWTEDPWTGAGGESTPGAAGASSVRYVIKGGSFLCADNFCMRYRPAARQPGDGAFGASHIGFRTVRD